jgi:hypothetical protein
LSDRGWCGGFFIAILDDRNDDLDHDHDYDDKKNDEDNAA